MTESKIRTEADSPQVALVKKALFAAHELRVDDALSTNTEDAYYRYGSFPGVQGIAAIRENLMSTHVDFMAKLEMEFLEIFDLGTTVIVEMNLRVHRTDGKIIEMPVVDVVRLTPDKTKIRDMRVYTDPSPLFAGLDGAHGESASAP
jgi:hypothetical protein